MGGIYSALVGNGSGDKMIDKCLFVFIDRSQSCIIDLQVERLIRPWQLTRGMFVSCL